MDIKGTYPEPGKQARALEKVESERNRALEELRESEVRFRNLIEGSIQGILIHRNHKPLFVNKKWAEIHGYSTKEILKMETVVPLISPEDQKRMLGFSEARCQGKYAPMDYEYRSMHKSGALIWLDNRVRVIQWGGQPAIQSTVFNITSRKQAESEREQLIDKLKKALEEVKTLQGIIPICSHCKKIRSP